MSSDSHFIISSQEAGACVREKKKNIQDDKCCYLLQLSFQPIYSDVQIPNSCYAKLPRLVNGIPLGPGLMGRDQLNSIRWRYIDGGPKIHTFISVPMHEDEAEETKKSLIGRLVKQSQSVFGDVSVRATVILSHCIHFDGDIILNDIAVSMEEGLHFRD
ncbi:hypothetical protein ACJMK2_034019 [Sinanodonta woodiana]|uniref:Uncharacterized protein n=1 Tax=Sinanodonta woodiana TaxID=1069815 RepID=A0ABD3WQV1_SINWO